LLPGDLTCLVAAHLTCSEGAGRENDLNPTVEKGTWLKSEEKKVHEEEEEEDRILGFIMGATIILKLRIWNWNWNRNKMGKRRVQE